MADLLRCPRCGAVLTLGSEAAPEQCPACRAQLSPAQWQTADTCQSMADSAFDNRDYLQAYSLYGALLDMTESNYLAAFRRGLCAGYLSTGGELRTGELIQGHAEACAMLQRLKQAKKIDPDYAAGVLDKMDSALTTFAVGRFHALQRVRERPTFESPQQAEEFAQSVRDCARLLQAAGDAVRRENDKKQLLSARISVCDIGLRERKLCCKSGVTDESGKAVQEESFYKIPKELYSDLQGLRQQAVQEHNALPSLRRQADRLTAEIAAEEGVISDYKSSRAQFLRENPELRASQRKFNLLTVVISVLAAAACGALAYFFTPWLWIGTAAALLIGALVLAIGRRRFARTHFPATLLAKQVESHRSRKKLRQKKDAQTRFREEHLKK